MINFILWTVTVCFCALIAASTWKVVRNHLDK